MKYMGSKRRIANDILQIVLNDRTPNQYYVEPFCGGCNVIDKVGDGRIANDSNEFVIAMWQALVNGWIPPNQVTEKEFNDIKANKNNYPKYLVGFVGIALSFGSKWFGCYAKDKRIVNYNRALEGRKNLLEQVNRLKGTIFKSCSFKDLEVPDNSIIYCDPPYENTSGYKDKFNHIEFWEWCRVMSKKGHKLFVSEYQAPSDFECIWQAELNTNLNAKIIKTSIEKLFIYNGHI